MYVPLAIVFACNFRLQINTCLFNYGIHHRMLQLCASHGFCFCFDLIRNTTTMFFRFSVVLSVAAYCHVFCGYMKNASHIFRDEFNGDALNSSTWRIVDFTDEDQKAYRESQQYHRNNVVVKDGFLTIVAQKDVYGNSSRFRFTSGRVDTKDKYQFQYGEIEWRAKIPTGTGLWTLLSLGRAYCSYFVDPCTSFPPALSFEIRGDDPHKIIASSLFILPNGTEGKMRQMYDSGSDTSQDFHLYKILRTRSKVVWYFDGKVVFSISDWAMIPPDQMQIIIRVAVGGNAVGPPDNTTLFPAKLVIDYLSIQRDENMISDFSDADGDSNNTTLAVVLGTILPIALAVAIGIGVYCRWRRRQMRLGDMRKTSDASTMSLYLSFMMSSPVNNAVQDYIDLLEIPLANLKIDDVVLGSGEYGFVKKGLATGLRGQLCKDPTVVAVKSVKHASSIEHIKQLMEEMKMMVKAGRHLNIVNLLGVVTKGEVFLLTEYCCYGSLLKYVKMHRGPYFCSQVDSAGYMMEHKDNEQEKLQKSIKHITKLGGTFPECSFDYAIVSTRDLIRFAFQISRGMEYLSGRSIIHRDLAARNVLVTDGLIAKIADFGMARQQEEYVVYDRSIPLPVRWMPPESITRRVFSQYSDVWSFGILLWEVFTLGDTPYSNSHVHGHTITEFVSSLTDGLQMERPPCCPVAVYDIMQSCWKLLPANRPIFREIQKDLQRILDAESAECYLSLDIPYQHFNKDYEEILLQISLSHGTE